MAEREWLPDPTGRHPFRSRKSGEWSDLVAVSTNGDGIETDTEGGREARSHDQPAEPTTWKPGRWGRWNVVAVIVVVVGLGGLWAWIQNYNSGQRQRSDEAIERMIDLGGRELEYCWSGSASSVDITMATTSGGTSQASGKANDQCVSAGEARSGTFAYLSAQISSDYGGTITCQIKVDGVVVEEVTSSGDYVIASCSGQI